MPRSSQSTHRRHRQATPVEEVVDIDDICQICHLLLLQPVTTTCRHTFCSSCFSRWADVSTNQMITGLDVDEPILLSSSNDVEARCPMCRSSSVATINQERIADLEAKYPNSYASRQDDAPFGSEDADGSIIEQITLSIGNEHRLHRKDSEQDKNVHEWRFFVQASRTEIIEEVQVFLHPTFRQNRVVLQHAPYSIRRVGWGTFTIYANIVLKAGYSWMSPDAEDSPDGAEKGKLPLEWMLDFRGRGSQGRLRLKVKKEKETQDEENERQTQSTRRMWMQQRERDPDYVPPEE